jgi:malonyl CoA-acyl carrier protein transacylase
MRTTLAPARDCEVFLLRGDSRESVVREAHGLRSALAQEGPHAALMDLAERVNSGPHRDFPACLSIVASSPEDLHAKLSRAVDRLSDPKTGDIKSKKGVYFFERPLYAKGRLAFLFPGEGSQYPHMLADLCMLFPEVRAPFDRIDRAFEACGLSGDFLPSEIVFPPSGAGEHRGGPPQGPEGLWAMPAAVAAVLTANQAVLELLGRLQIRPDCALGHSTGEYSAFQAAGILEVGDPSRYGLYISELHRIYREATARGAVHKVRLAAAGADAETVAGFLASVGAEVHIAMDNCPHQAVFLGAEPEMQKALRAIGERGVICQVLPFDRPYHTPLFRAYAEGLRPFFEKWLTGRASLPTYSCTIADRFPEDRRRVCDIAVDHWAKPVRFRQTIEKMYADGVRIFVEVGPRGNLTSFVGDILGKREGLALAANTAGRSGIAQIHHAVGLLAAHGVPLCTDSLYAGRPRVRLPYEASSREDDRPGSGPAPMRIELELPRLRLDAAAGTLRQGLRSPKAQIPPPDTEPSSPAMDAYFDAMERFLSVQREVMEAYLAGAGDPVAADARFDLSEVFARVRNGQGSSLTGLGSCGTVSEPGPQSPDLPRPCRNPTAGPGKAPSGAPAPLPAAEADRAGRPGPLRGMSAEALKELLLARISERTGYPLEMLDPKIDLEADLGIDSIKRIEILGSLWEADPSLDPAGLEKVASEKTLGAMIASLARLSGTAEAPHGGPSKIGDPEPAAGKEEGFPVEAVSRLPLLDEVLSFSAGRELVARRTFAPDRDLFLKDHTIGRHASVTEPGRTALPVMPLTMSMEMMAEAASLLVPGKRIVGMRAFRGYRWILFDRPQVALKAVAERIRETDQVHVRIFELEQDPASGAVPIAEGTALFGTEYPRPPEPAPFSLTGERASAWAADRLYSDRMFHGPSWQGVASVDRCGEDGAAATLEVLSSDRFFSPPRPGAFLTDPIVLDAAGQVMGFWAMERLEEGFLVFPYRFEALYLYGPRQEVGRKAACLARTRLEGPQRVFTEFDILGPDGGPWMRIEAWEDKRFRLPERAYAFLLSPVEVIAGEPWEEPFSSFRESGPLCCLRLGELFRGDDEFWRHVFAGLILNPEERRAFRSLGLSPKESTEWLLVRLLAKDAVRTYLRQNHGIVLGPADVEIATDERGRPVPGGSWARGLDPIPCLCLAHAEGLTAAVAWGPEGSRSFGIHIEGVTALEKEARESDLLPEERELLLSINGASRQEWILRSRASKAAAARALGRKGPGRPAGLVLRAVDPSAGELRLALCGELGRDFPDLADRPIRVRTLREAGHIVASTVVQRSRHDRGNP